MYNYIMYWPVIVGAVAGIGACAISVISMGGIIQRPDQNGNLRPTPENLIEYIKLPFDPDKSEVAWPLTHNIDLKDRLKIASLNWVTMACLGAGVGAGINLLLF